MCTSHCAIYAGRERRKSERLHRQSAAREEWKNCFANIPLSSFQVLRSRRKKQTHAKLLPLFSIDVVSKLSPLSIIIMILITIFFLDCVHKSKLSSFSSPSESLLFQPLLPLVRNRGLYNNLLKALQTTQKDEGSRVVQPFYLHMYTKLLAIMTMSYRVFCLSLASFLHCLDLTCIVPSNPVKQREAANL